MFEIISSPLFGSSQMMVSISPIRLTTICMFFFIPVEQSVKRLYKNLSISKKRINTSVSFGGLFFPVRRIAVNSIFSMQVNRGYKYSSVETKAEGLGSKYIQYWLCVVWRVYILSLL